ncbi:hypothetical protein JIN84_14920 [Luteolibacter yonseiensis]|uniref:Uncharacterized protein n=1 Tax=Luteolibacter yonseiensis TaxID=1144680 RepID=A0A934R626_9BACT|nr:hypothetical protein [Luteolibacter yonseiensis]MBK1816916.1 hypothetical protein [Luteolibacter yonseiensis]
MKHWPTLSFVVSIGISTCLTGTGIAGPECAGTAPSSTAALAELATAPGPLKPKPRTGPDVLTPESAATLAKDERIALLKKATLLSDPEKQADILCGLIRVMTQDELEEATKTLLDAQRAGNSWSQDVWNSLWTQWGRVNPEGCLAMSKTGAPRPGSNDLNGLNTPDDYRCLMVGWLETQPEAAMTWARQPQDDLREATAAAFAITGSAKGDAKQMEAAILSVSNNELTTRACFREYFDLATSTGANPTAAEVYDRLDAKLQPAAWPEVMRRLTASDPTAAASWFEKHGNDRGHDPSATAALVGRLAEKDPEGTAKWAVKLPVSPENQHPGVIAYTKWQEIDPAAAKAWAKTQPEGMMWIREPSQRPAGAVQ